MLLFNSELYIKLHNLYLANRSTVTEFEEFLAWNVYKNFLPPSNCPSIHVTCMYVCTITIMYVYYSYIPRCTDYWLDDAGNWYY